MALVIAVSSCATRDALEAEADLSIRDEAATDANGDKVIGRALLRQARDELAVLSQPALDLPLDALAASRAPRSLAQATTPAGSGSPATAAAPAATPATSPAAAFAAPPTAPPAGDIALAAAANQASMTDATGGQAAAGEAPERPGFFRRWFGSRGGAESTAGDAGTPSGVATTAATAAIAAPVSSGGSAAATASGSASPSAAAAGSLAMAPGLPATAAVTPVGTAPAAGPAGMYGADASPLALPVAPRTSLTSTEIRSINPADGRLSNPPPVNSPPINPLPSNAAPESSLSSNSQPSNPQPSNPLPSGPLPSTAPAAGQASTSAGVAAAPGVPLTAALRTDVRPLPGDVEPLDAQLLERGNFATLMGAMYGMVERCDGQTMMRDQALQSFRSTYALVDLDRQQRSDAALRQRTDSEFDRSVAAARTGGQVDCDYVRAQSYRWRELASDLRRMDRQSALQYRQGLITEVRRGAGFGAN